MEPVISYAQASDGVNIAYWALGKGPPVVFMPTTLSHIELEWRTGRGALYERLAQHLRLVRYDGRGHGLSDRDPGDISLDALMSDLDAVADHQRLGRFAMLAQSHAGPVAIAYAATRPERVSHLVLWHAYPRGSDFRQSTEVQTLLQLVDKDWELYSLTLAHSRAGWARSEDARELAGLLRASVDPEFYKRRLQAELAWDSTALLSQVTAPTLVLHRRNFEGTDVKVSSFMASQIPAARLSIVEGESNLLEAADDPAVVEIERFLGVETEAAPRVRQPWARPLPQELTAREVETLRLLAMGRRNKEIASELNLSIRTVESHVAAIYEKIGAHSRADAATYAIRSGLIP